MRFKQESPGQYWFIGEDPVEDTWLLELGQSALSPRGSAIEPEGHRTLVLTAEEINEISQMLPENGVDSENFISLCGMILAASGIVYRGNSR